MWDTEVSPRFGGGSGLKRYRIPPLEAMAEHGFGGGSGLKQ